MESTSWIDVNDLPHAADGFSKLYCDYLSNYQKVQQYFETDFHSPHSVESYIERLRKEFKHRDLLVEVLTEQNRNFGASDATLDRIKLFADENTFAVVTGQQVSILGGPLYTFYKTITAIKLARQLSAQFPDSRFIPIFWLEGEDHDFEEANKVGVLNSDHLPVKVEYLLNGKPTPKNVGAVGDIPLDDYLPTFFSSLEKTLGNSEFKKPLFEIMQGSYRENITFSHAFAAWMGKLFEGDGLVFLSSNDKRLKQLMAPIFQKELLEYPRVSQLIIQQSAELEERYHAQIKTKALNLFYFYKGGRYFIEPRENDFSLKGTRHFISKEEMHRIAVETPELLSPNVALRPICQDTILPTVAYIAGPSEVAYFAQLKTVYAYFGLTMPVIYPRATSTIIEEKFERTMEKYELHIMDFFCEPDKIGPRVIELISEVKIEEMFKAALQKVNDQANEMKFGLNYIDPTLLSSLENNRAKMEHLLMTLKEKVEAAQRRKHEIALRQVDRAASSIFPNKNFQERELSIVHFMNKHGLEFLRFLQSEIQIGQSKHQLIRI